MKIMNLSALILASVLSSHVALAADQTIQCVASGRSLSNNGGGLLPANANFTFVDATDAQGLRVLSEINGSIKTLSNEFSNSYIGNFTIASLTENPSYRARRYTGYSQFKDFRATNTDGSAEDGMWGYLVLQKDTSQPKFQAHYIFQAGDHMGGTLHMSCKVLR